MFFVLLCFITQVLLTGQNLLKSVSGLSRALVSLWLRGQQVPSDVGPNVKVPNLCIQNICAGGGVQETSFSNIISWTHFEDLACWM